jgi:hypothetical protein
MRHPRLLSSHASGVQDLPDNHSLAPFQVRFGVIITPGVSPEKRLRPGYSSPSSPFSLALAGNLCDFSGLRHRLALSIIMSKGWIYTCMNIAN